MTEQTLLLSPMTAKMLNRFKSAWSIFLMQLTTCSSSQGKWGKKRCLGIKKKTLSMQVVRVLTMIRLVNCLTSHVSAYWTDHTYVSIRSLRSSAGRRQSKPNATTPKRNKYVWTLQGSWVRFWRTDAHISIFHAYIVVQSSALHVLQFWVINQKTLEGSRTVIDRMKYPFCSESLSFPCIGIKMQ